jgi:hypothetical protein
MSTLTEELARIKVKEILRESADARANRERWTAHSNPVARKLRFAITSTLVVLWMIWALIGG